MNPINVVTRGYLSGNAGCIVTRGFLCDYFSTTWKEIVRISLKMGKVFYSG